MGFFLWFLGFCFSTCAQQGHLFSIAYSVKNRLAFFCICWFFFLGNPTPNWHISWHLFLAAAAPPRWKNGKIMCVGGGKRVNYVFRIGHTRTDAAYAKFGSSLVRERERKLSGIGIHFLPLNSFFMSWIQNIPKNCELRKTFKTFGKFQIQKHGKQK